MQLRTLMMDELPAIIHRLSLRLWCPEYGLREEEEMAQAATSEEAEVTVNPFASPSLDAVDSQGSYLDASEISSLSLDGGSEIHSLFSQKNLLRLAALTNSHRTLSLFTPSIRDAVFRAWAGPSERTDSAGTSTPATPGLLRSQSSLAITSTTYTFTNKSSEDGHTTISTRPSLVSLHTATTGLSLGAGRHSRSHSMRKKKNRVVNLRKSKITDDITSESGDSETSSAAPASEPLFSSRVPEGEEPEDNIMTPPSSPSSKVRFRTSSIDLGDSPRKLRPSTTTRPNLSINSKYLPEDAIIDPAPLMENPGSLPSTSTVPILPRRPEYIHQPVYCSPEKISSNVPQLSPTPILSEPTSRGIIEQAWVLKMAGELARRSHDEKSAREALFSPDEREDAPPPAYQPKA